MSRLIFFSIIVTGISMTAAPFALAQDARAQQAMRAMTARLRAAETERDTLQAAKIQSDQEKKALTDKLDALSKQAAADSKDLAATKARLAELETESAQLNELLQKLQ
ncbi:MAG TPA: hypothetical protein VGH00_02175, partial [Chthoniobacterales bacterium]